MNRRILLLLLGGFAVIAGVVCYVLTRKVAAGDFTSLPPDKCNVWGDVGKDDVVLKVGDRDFSKADIDRFVSVQRRLVELNHEVRPGKREAMVAEFLKRAALTLPLFKYMAGQFPDNQVLDEELLKRQRRGYLLQFGRKKQKWADFEKDLEHADLLADVTEIIEMETKFEWVLAHTYSNDLVVTEKELAAMNAKIDAYLAKVAATNVLNYAAASNAWQRLERGDDFAKVADECSQDPEKNPGGDWGEKTKDDFVGESAHYQDVVAHLKEGEYTEVLEGETGLEIIKLVKVVPAIMANSGEDSWQMSRIFFRRAYTPDRESDEELMAEMRQDKRVEFLAKKTDEAVKTGKIVYPFSRRVFRIRAPKVEAAGARQDSQETVKSAMTNGVEEVR